MSLLEEKNECNTLKAAKKTFGIKNIYCTQCGRNPPPDICFHSYKSLTNGGTKSFPFKDCSWILFTYNNTQYCLFYNKNKFLHLSLHFYLLLQHLELMAIWTYPQSMFAWRKGWGMSLKIDEHGGVTQKAYVRTFTLSKKFNFVFYSIFINYFILFSSLQTLRCESKNEKKQMNISTTCMFFLGIWIRILKIVMLGVQSRVSEKKCIFDKVCLPYFPVYKTRVMSWFLRFLKKFAKFEPCQPCTSYNLLGGKYC